MRDANADLVINTSITQSLNRTVITSLTTLLAVLAIYIFSTSSIKTFALSLMIGVVVGTYSSMFVAAPTVLIWRQILARRSRPVARPTPPGSAAGAVAQPAAIAPASDPAAGDASGAAAAGPPGSVSVVRTQRLRQTRRRRRS
jgi:preprotein translocase subunit SecF